jgi:hypothetical protein
MLPTTSLPLFETRREAFTRIAPTKQETYDRILLFARDRRSWGLTADEIALDWNCSHNHSSPRISELLKAGKLIATKRRRPTRTGSPATVFVLPEFA